MDRLRKALRRTRPLLGFLWVLLTFKPRDWVMIAIAYWWLFRARWLMRRLKGEQWFQPTGQLRRYSSPVMQSKNQRWIIQRAGFVSFAAGAPYQWAPCLQRSLALREWLSRGDIDTELKLGVRRDKRGAFMAHAWLEYEGKIINDTDGWVGTFARLSRGPMA